MNEIGRHVSTMVYTKVVTNKSPWLRKAELGRMYMQFLHLMVKDVLLQAKNGLKNYSQNGQVATQYVNLNGEPTMDDRLQSKWFLLCY